MSGCSVQLGLRCYSLHQYRHHLQSCVKQIVITLKCQPWPILAHESVKLTFSSWWSEVKSLIIESTTVDQLIVYLVYYVLFIVIWQGLEREQNTIAMRFTAPHTFTNYLLWVQKWSECIEQILFQPAKTLHNSQQ